MSERELLIETVLYNNLAGKSIAPRINRSNDLPALLITSDGFYRSYFDEVKSTYHPDGYVVGVGVGGILPLLLCFDEGVLPKGLIMVDHNPHVVVAGKIMAQELSAAQGYQEFLQRFFQCSSEDYQKKS